MKKIFILVLAVLLMAPLGSNAMAAGSPVKISGHTTFTFGRNWRDTNDSTMNNTWGVGMNQVWGGAAAASAAADNSDTDSYFWGYGRIVFKFAPTDNISGLVRMDVENRDSVGNIRAKLWYGVWNAGWSKITIGRQYTIVGALGAPKSIFKAWTNDRHMS